MKSKNRKKKIIFFLPVFNIGGAGESILKLTKFLSTHKFSILVISIGKNFYSREFKKFGCEIIELKSKRTLYAIFKIRNLLKKEIKKNYLQTILISNIHYANIISLISCIKLKKIKLIFTERSSISELKIYNNFFSYIKNQIIFFLAKYCYKYSDLIITNSKFEENFIKNEFQIKKIKSIYPPSISKINREKKKIINFNHKKIIDIIYVGRLSKEKGLFIILNALNEIKNKLNFIFTIYGNGEDKDSIDKYIKNKNLNNIVSLKGFVEDKKFMFRKADLFINASLWEGLPNALVQSINYNVFPICSDAPGGNLEVINKGEFGLTFKTNDHKDLQKKIIQFMNGKFKFNNKRRITHLKKYTEKKSNQKYLNTINTLY